MSKTTCDIIVVGAGSAGCALAYRLAQSTSLDVVLLEAGSPAHNPMMHIPLGFAFLLKEHRNNWSEKTLPEPGLKQRRIDLPRGKVLGGCSAINGMVYVRGQAQDYDRWAELGNTGWSYQDVLPYFKRSEDCENGANFYHGVGGPLWVGNINTHFPICDAFIDAAEQAGHPRNHDINATSQEGVGWFPTNIKNGRRLSSASAFLNAGKQLPNLTVITGVETHRVLLEQKRAVGVEYYLKKQSSVLIARKQVVLCAGALNSPKILELSGIGQTARLQALGIDVIKNLPGVGENLHDHWNSYLIRSIDRGANYFSESKPLAMLRNLLRYLFTRKSFLANPAALVTVFYKALANAERTDAQIHFAPAASKLDEKGNMLPIEAVTISSCGLRPCSRGATHIRSKRVEDKPNIQVNYLDTERDQAVAVAAFRKVRDIFQANAMQTYGGEELKPGRKIVNDADILDYIRETGEPVHHLVGSCKMGQGDMAVVDQQLRVRGIEGLRIADASIMPEIVSGNTHAACVMIAEKAADFIQADCSA
jgi:choline dehydrogenase